MEVRKTYRGRCHTGGPVGVDEIRDDVVCVRTSGDCGAAGSEVRQNRSLYGPQHNVLSRMSYVKQGCVHSLMHSTPRKYTHAVET